MEDNQKIRKVNIFIYNKGFTLIELLLVIAIIMGIVFFTIPIGVIFFQNQILDETNSDVLGVLRRGYNQAVLQKNDSNFGIKFLSNSYVLFQGESYVTRVQSNDETFVLPTGIDITGIDEIVFEKYSGTPNITGVLTITSGSDNKKLDINSSGKVERY